ncbi:MAG: alpha/beta hydrolase [Brevibacterium sp.]
MKSNLLATAIGNRLACSLFHPPRKGHHRTPGDMGLPVDEAITHTPDGIQLHFWLIPGHGAGTAIVGHGIGLTKSSSLRQAGLLHELGYHVLMFDHRNHGLSGTDKSRRRLAERYSHDIAAAIAGATSIWPSSPRLIVWGFSFSAFPTLYSLRHADSPIDGIICDSGPGFDIDAMLRDFLTGGHLPAPKLLNRLVRNSMIANAFATAAVAMLGAQWPPDPERSVSGITPMLFLAGSADELGHVSFIGGAMSGSR